MYLFVEGVWHEDIFSCLATRHLIFVKPHYFKSLWFRATYLFPLITYKKVQIPSLHSRDYNDERVCCKDRKSLYINNKKARFFFLFSLVLLHHSTNPLLHHYPHSIFRACHSSQRQHSGSSFPEGVSAGHGVKPNRGVLLRTRSSFPAELNVQVQSYSCRGPETAVTSWVPQCVVAWRGFTQVRAQTHLTRQQAGLNAISLSFFFNIKQCGQYLTA